MADYAVRTVANYIDAARVLLQDRLEPFRYGTDELVLALNLALADARRLRPDLFLKFDDYLPPAYSTEDLTEAVDFPSLYRSALVFYMVGFSQLRDEEDTSDARASALFQKFSGTLLGGQSLVSGYAVIQ